MTLSIWVRARCLTTVVQSPPQRSSGDEMVRAAISKFVVALVLYFECDASSCATEANGNSSSRSGGSVLLQRSASQRHAAVDVERIQDVDMEGIEVHYTFMEAFRKVVFVYFRPLNK